MKQPASQPANRLERLFANLIDTFVLMLPAALLLNVAGPESALAVLGSFACQVAYYVAFTASDWQATPGKRLFAMRVERLDGAPLTQRDALERFLAYVIPSLPLYSTLLPAPLLGILAVWLSFAWFLPIIIRPDQRGLHDLICRTRVVRTRPV